MDSTKLINQHKDNILFALSDKNYFYSDIDYTESAKSCAETTKSIAIEFATWYGSGDSKFKEWLRQEAIKGLFSRAAFIERAFPYWLNNIYDI